MSAQPSMKALVAQLLAERDEARAALQRVRERCERVENRMMATAKPSEIRAALAAAEPGEQGGEQ